MEKRSTISKKTLKIILGICIGVTILAVAGVFVYTYLAARWCERTAVSHRLLLDCNHYWIEVFAASFNAFAS